MRRILILVLVALAGWYAWGHWRALTEHRPKHEAILENHSGRTMERVRISVGGQTFVRESVADGTEETIPFLVNEDASFTLEWKWPGQDFDQHWSGGFVPRGPMVQKHHLYVDNEGSVVYQAEQKLGQ